MAQKKEKRVKKEKNNLLTVLIFFIIIFFIAYMAVYFIGSKHSKNSKNKTETVELHKYDVDVEKIDLKDERVQKVISNFNAFEFGEMVYQYDSYELEDISMYRYIVATLNSLDKERVAVCINGEEELKGPVTLEEFNAVAKTLADINISMEDIVNNAQETSNKVGNLGYGPYSLKVDGNNIYVVEACEKAKNELPYVVTNSEAEVFGDYVNLYQRVAFGKEKNGKVSYYDNHYREGTAYETLESKVIPNFSKHKYALYKITFLKVGDNYYFQSMESR